MATCEEWHEEETPIAGRPSFTVGKHAANGGKGRHWVVVKSQGSIMDLWHLAKDTGNGAIVALFSEGPHALLHKPFDAVLKITQAGITMHSPIIDGRVSMKSTKDTCDKFTTAGIVGNIMIKVKTNDFDQNAWQMVMEGVEGMVNDTSRLREFMANASYAVRKKRATALQDAAHHMERYVSQFVDDKKNSDAMLKHIDDTLYKFPADYIETLLDIVGVYWDF